MSNMQHVVIIGNGVSGITAARHIRKLGNDRITVISAETDHFFSRTALMYIFMGHMKYEHTKPYEDWFWEKNGIELKRAWVKNIHFDQKNLVFDDDTSLSYDKLILAVGSKSNKFGWPGQELNGVQGLYSYQDLEMMERNTKDVNHAVIVGGGLIGVEMAEMLHSRNIPVTMLVREDRLWGNILPKEEGALISRHIQEHHVDLRLNTELSEITDDNAGQVKAILTKEGEKIACQFVGLTVGVSPNIEFLEGTALNTNRGILVNEYLETNIPGVYALGDCAEFSKHPDSNRRPVEQVWYTGKMMGETVAQTITGNRTVYNPGVWFNSAKFFNIEYQTYGWVWAEPKGNEQAFYWEHPDGKKCLKFIFDKKSEALLGINTFGIRLRHEVCEYWIKSGIKIEQVLIEFKDANFDPEFFQHFEVEIIALFNSKFGKSVKVGAKSWKRILNTFS